MAQWPLYSFRYDVDGLVYDHEVVASVLSDHRVGLLEGRQLQESSLAHWQPFLKVIEWHCVAHVVDLVKHSHDVRGQYSWLGSADVVTCMASSCPLILVVMSMIYVSVVDRSWRLPTRVHRGAPLQEGGALSRRTCW
jgi:hypothetical protein